MRRTTLRDDGGQRRRDRVVAVLGLALARIVGVADALFDESADWLWFGGKVPDQSARRSRNEALVARYAAQLPELFGDRQAANEDASGVEVPA